jgi:hypothetical protein
MFTVVVSIKGLKDMWFTGLNKVEAENKCKEYNEFGYTQIIKED